MTKIVVVTGPTATGKTTLGIELAKKFDGEIISADSQQVYKGLDEERGKDGSFPQWGLDLVASGYSVSDWVKYATAKIAEIASRKKISIVVGGSGQYIKELLNPSPTLHVPPNPQLRAKLEKLSVQQLQDLVTIKMNRSDGNNPRRLIRAIEIQNSKFKSQNFKAKVKSFDALVVGLTAPREVLYQKIVARRRDRPDLVEKEFKLAKKQLVYLRKYLPAVWFDITDPKLNNSIAWQVEKFLGLPKSKKNATLTT